MLNLGNISVIPEQICVLSATDPEDTPSDSKSVIRERVNNLVAEVVFPWHRSGTPDKFWKIRDVLAQHELETTDLLQ